ncbi:unnamed protein product, partial [Amoebophrya sp. A120]
GRLGQVPTGEGKTMIVAILAAILALRNQTVDIITASEELAKPAAEEMKGFFSLFGFSAAAISEDTNWTQHIIYGDASQFQFADLRYRFAEEHQKGAGRGAEMRPYQVAIIDESDSLMVDGKGSQALLGSSAPGAHYLQNFIIIAWGIMLNGKKSLRSNSSPAPTTSTGGSSTSGAGPETGDVHEEKDNLDVLKQITPIEHLGLDPSDTSKKPLYKDWSNYLSQKIEAMLRQGHHRDYIVRTGIVQWSLAAVDAMYHLEQDKHYRLKTGTQGPKVELIDMSNTGCVSDTSQFTGGLAQFLEFKHGLTMTPSGFTTNYISNAGYFKKYDKIFGLTGTLGDAETRDFLNDTYKLDFFFVPGFKSKQFHMLRGIFHFEGTAWKDAVLRQTLVQAKLGRAVLVICESLSDAKMFHKQFTKKIDEPNPQDVLSANDAALSVSLYTEQSERAAAVGSGDQKRKLEPGTIIVTTNIAGRGTDINLTDEVEKNGGLHVIITFRPQNDRVQQQNVGRTSRTGNRGTAQLILN